MGERSNRQLPDKEIIKGEMGHHEVNAESDGDLEPPLEGHEKRYIQVVRELEKLKYSEQIVKESRDFFRSIVHGMRDVAVVVSTRGIIEYVSPSITNVGGYDPQEITGIHVANFFVQSDDLIKVEKLRELILFTSDQPDPIEFLFKAKNRPPFFVEALGRSILNGKEAISIAVTLRNIEQMKRLELMLDAGEKEYRRLFEHTGYGEIIVSKDATISKVNEIFVKKSGYTRKEIEGKAKWTDFLYPEDALEALRIWERSIKASCHHTQLVAHEFRAWKKDRQLINVIGRYMPFEDTDHIVVSITDITQLKRTEKALRASEKKLSTLMRNIPGMAYSCSDYRNFTLSFVSDGAKYLTGFNAKSLMGGEGLHYRNLIHPEDREMVFSQLAAAVKEKTAFHINYRIRNRNRTEKWVLQTGQAITSESGAFLSIEGIVIDATESARKEFALKQENLRLKTRLKDSDWFGNIIGKSPLMQNVYQLIIKASEAKHPVMIYGESGTGKELVARAIHDLSERRHRPFIAVNCGAIPENLFESEFFGYKKGAFTGATHNKKGYFDEANGGTLFLDEIGEISLLMQVKLLRVLEDGSYIPVGDFNAVYSDARIIGATNRDFNELMNQGKIREDFYYRLHIVPIRLPPLRERLEDLPLLIEHFLKQQGKQETIDIDDSTHLIEKLRHHRWPGNIRELQNVLSRYLTIGNLDFLIHPTSQPHVTGDESQNHNPDDERNLHTIISDMEKIVILDRLKKYKWNKSKTAVDLGIDRKTLLKKIKHYGFA